MIYKIKMKSDNIEYTNIIKSLDTFKVALIKNFPNINSNNLEFINKMYQEINLEKIKGKIDFIKRCSLYFKNKRLGKGVSKISKEYW